MPTVRGRLKLCLMFWRSFGFTSVLLSLLCAWFLYKYGGGILSVLFWFKIITLGTIFLYINSYKNREYFFYKNLGVGKKTLWIFALTLDLAIWTILSIVALNLYG